MSRHLESQPCAFIICSLLLISDHKLHKVVMWYKTSLSTYPCTTTLMINSRITSSLVKCEWSNRMLQILHLYKCQCIHDDSGGIFIRAVCCEESRRENNILAHIQCTVKRNNRNVHIQTHEKKIMAEQSRYTAASAHTNSVSMIHRSANKKTLSFSYPWTQCPSDPLLRRR